VRLNNTRQTLPLLLLLLPYFSPPSTSSCPHSFQLGLYCSPLPLSLSLYLYLSLSLSLSTFSSISSHLSLLFSSYARHLPVPSGPSRVIISTSPGVLPFFLFCFVLFVCLFFDESVCKSVPFKVHVLFYCFNFALLCCIICCQVCLPVFVTHICKSLFKDNTLLFNLFLCMCVYEQ